MTFKAFDNVPQDVLFEKVKTLPLNPYVVNCLINQDRERRVTVDGITTKFLRINRGVPQGTVLGPILFSIIINDIKATDLKNELCKFADDITVEAPGYEDNDTGTTEVENIKLWSENNRVTLNKDKTY